MFSNMSSYLQRAKEKVALSSNMKFFLIFLCVRILSVFVVSTWYVPDEYWQSLEIAHNMVFGYGYTTWEWVLGLRSYLHPLLIAFLYKILHLLGMDTVSLLVVGPRICQAVLSAYADLKFYHWSGNHKWAAFNIACSWFWFYTGSRTLINSFETSISVIALARFPWPGREERDYKFLWLVALACAARPTAAVMWVPLCGYHIWRAISNKDLISTLLKYAFVAVVTLTLSITLDSLCYGQLVITPWQFLKLNVLQDVGSWYGTQPWHWYLSNGLPTVLGLHLLPFALAAVQAIRHKEAHTADLLLLATLIFTVVVFSFLPHKEFRFVLPLLPIALHLSSDLIARWSCKASKLHLWLVAGVLLVSNAIPAAYLGVVHQRGTLDVMEPLAELSSARPNDTSILFLMPCHSTPLFSHIHENIAARFLTCEPNLAGDDSYKDEADRFYENPNAWLRAEYPPNGTLPSHIVTFDALVPAISSILSRYKPIYRFAHTSVPLSSRIGYHVIVHQHVQY